MHDFIHKPIRWVSLLVLVVLLGNGAWAKGKDSGFESALRSLEKRGARVSAQIVNLTNTRTLLALHADDPLNPASSIKLFTAYTAIERLGIDYVFKTAFHLGSDGSLCIKGGGDPSLVMEDLYLVVGALKRKGLERYSGAIRLDSTVFDDEFYPEDRSDQDSERAYNAPISGLNFNYNTVSVFVNPGKKGAPAITGLDFPFDFVRIEGKVQTGGRTEVTWDKKGKGDLEIIHLGGRIAEGADEWRKPFRIRKPVQAFGEALATMLDQGGISASGKVRITEGACLGEPFHLHQSRPLPFIVNLMNKYSNNFIADSLVKAVDHAVSKRPGSAGGGLKYIRTELMKIGIPAESKGRKVVSGSGLTDGNRVAASDFTLLMKHVHREKKFLPEFFASLPIAGIDGTLKRKYHGSDVMERLRGKTGTLSSVQSLVGVYPNDEGEWLSIAIIVNGGHGIPEGELARFLSAH
jgi:D-alanyl-D-alanine carboxypeptidase/D-alanyl-D-alanine-endopeptidase (penicillin-binding protein 4)